MARQAHFILGVLLLSITAACSKSTPPPEDPPPATDGAPADGGDAVTPASSDAVKQGRDQIEAGDFAGAAETLGKAAEADPKDPQAAYYHGFALDQLERFDDAEKEYRRAIELSPELMEAHVNLSFLLLASDKPKEALAATDAGLKVDAKNPSLLANRAEALDVLGDPRAIEAYDALFAVDPNAAGSRYEYARLLAAKDRKADAVAALDAIRVADVAEPEFLMDIADLYGRLESYAGCVKTFDVAIGRKKSAELLARRARCKYSGGDAKGAEADLNEAVALEPNNPIGHYYLGKHLNATGKKAQGKAALQKAVSLGPDTPFGKAAAEELKKK